MKINNFIKTAGFLFAVFSCYILTAQNERTKTAESIFKKYHKFELFGGASLLFVRNEANAIDLQYKDAKAFSFGLHYNFFQTGNFNFKIGAIKRTYHLVNTRMIKKEDLNAPYDFGGELKTDVFRQYLFPITAEYFMRVSRTLTLSFGLGPELTYFPNGEFKERPNYRFEDGTRVGGVTVGSPNDNGLSIGFNTSLGLNIEAGPLLLRPMLIYHYQPETLYTNVVTTQNLQVSENTISKHEVTGNYIMLGLSISLKRGLFGKKKNK